uniref:Tumor necrosis factor ligand superfamily member 15 n=1 Tax=Zosterops lateralis melanops TaxID=1220523 RepID=A0A8D2NJL3_ZOSLA
QPDCSSEQSLAQVSEQTLLETLQKSPFSSFVLLPKWRGAGFEEQQKGSRDGFHATPTPLAVADSPTLPLPLCPPAVKKQDLASAVGSHLPILQWEDKRGLAFTKNNLSYSSNALVIPVSGDYYVYAQVTFRGPVESLHKPNSVTEIITKVTDSYPEPTQLLTGTKTLSENGNGWFQPIYLGAVVSLEVGDKLMVNVSDIRLVDYTKEHKTFFGAFLL